jgi:hypothetical protein
VTGRRARSSSVLALALLLAASVARADPPSAEASPKQAAAREPSAKDRARARRLFEEATELEGRREWSRAADKLAEALSIVETPGLRYHLAFCQEEQGLMVEALGNYDRVEQLIAAGNEAADVAELLVPKRDALRLRVPKVRVTARPPAQIDGVAVNGVLVARERMEAPIPLNPGNHRLTVWARNHSTPVHREVTAKEGATTVEQFAWSLAPAPVKKPLPPSPVASSEPPKAERSGISGRTVILISEASLTAVALGLGVGFHLSANRAGSDADALRAQIPSVNGCHTQPRQLACVQLSEANDREKDHRRISQVALITGAVGAGATVATWFLWPASRDAALGVSAAAKADAGGVEVSGRF